MKTAEEQLQRLKIWERIIGFYISVVLLLCAAIILFHPPLSLTITEKNGTVVSTNTIESSNAYEQIMTSSNQSTVIIILLVAGCIFTFYSINGLRFTKIIIGKDCFGLESKNWDVFRGSYPGETSGKQESSKSEEVWIDGLSHNPKAPEHEQNPPKDEAVPENRKPDTNNHAKEQFQNKTFFERKILNTLWRYQQRYTSPDEHWTFTLYKSHPEYANFQGAIAKLIESRLVYFDMHTEQYSLTASGREFMEAQDKEPEEGEFYPFIVKGYR